MEFEDNPCIRCGKIRIKASEKIITINSSKAKLTVFVCPDKACQKIVDKERAAKEARRLEFYTRKKAVVRKPISK